MEKVTLEHGTVGILKEPLMPKVFELSRRWAGNDKVK
jgi:hypothetical protein